MAVASKTIAGGSSRKAAAASSSSRKTYLKMVEAAINAINNGNRGVSRYAIEHYVCATNNLVDKRAHHHIMVALKKGLDGGIFKTVKDSGKGAGHYKINVEHRDAERKKVKQAAAAKKTKLAAKKVERSATKKADRKAKKAKVSSRKAPKKKTSVATRKATPAKKSTSSKKAVAKTGTKTAKK